MDGGVNDKDRGKTFTYTVIPVRGTGPDDLKLQREAAGSIPVRVPEIRDGQIATYFNRAVVSAQSFLRLKDQPLERQMEWLANGLQDAITGSACREREWVKGAYREGTKGYLARTRGL